MTKHFCPVKKQCMAKGKLPCMTGTDCKVETCGVARTYGTQRKPATTMPPELVALLR